MSKAIGNVAIFCKLFFFKYSACVLLDMSVLMQRAKIIERDGLGINLFVIIIFEKQKTTVLTARVFCFFYTQLINRGRLLHANCMHICIFPKLRGVFAINVAYLCIFLGFS